LSEPVQVTDMKTCLRNDILHTEWDVSALEVPRQCAIKSYFLLINSLTYLCSWLAYHGN